MVDIGFIFKYLAYLYFKICSIDFTFDDFYVSVAGVFIFSILCALVIRLLYFLSE